MKKQTMAIFVLALIMIFLPLHLRYADGNTTLTGSEAHYHARMAKTITQGIPDVDAAIVNVRAYTLEPYHLVLAGLYSIFGNVAFSLAPAIFAILSFIALCLILYRLNISENKIPWILLAFALSPPLIATGILGTSQSFVLFLFLIGYLLMFTRAWVLGIASIIIVSLSGSVYNIAVLVSLIILTLLRKEHNFRVNSAIITSAIIFVLWKHPNNVPAVQGLSQYVSDFGGFYGFSLFAFLLALVGAMLIWKHKGEYYGAYALLIGLLVASFFYPQLLIFSNIAVSCLAGVALAQLSQRKWDLRFLRHATLLVLFCGLLFSSISHVVTLAETEPTPDIFKALEAESGTVFTHEKYGFWVQMAGHKAVTDSLVQYVQDSDELKYDVSTIFRSNDIEQTQQLLDKYNVTYVMISPEMRHGLVWEREQQGLDFIVENSETFKRVETGSSISLWQRE